MQCVCVCVSGLRRVNKLTVTPVWGVFQLLRISTGKNKIQVETIKITLLYLFSMSVSELWNSLPLINDDLPESSGLGSSKSSYTYPAFDPNDIVMLI